MHRLMYVSTAASDLTESDLDDILAISRNRNAADHITGMLLFIDGNFLQVLEGKEDAVHLCYARIRADARHNGLQLLMNAPCMERLFPGWSMGFDRAVTADERKADVFRATRAIIENAVSPEQALDVAVLLRTFYRVNADQHAA